MENVPQLSTAADLEMRAARVADPGIDLKTKHVVACELREMIDTVRDADSSRVIPHMIPVLLEILRSGEPSFQKDSLEYSFRRVLLEILHRIPSSEVIRPQAVPLFQGMLHLLRHDNEENGITCCKTMVDLVRSFRSLNEELLNEFMTILHEIFRNIRGLVEEVLSENSPTLDPNIVFPSVRSFKVLAEMALVVVSFLQINRTMVFPIVQQTLPMNFDVLSIESPAQKKAREDYEAMGGFWAGMAPTVRNSQAYTDFISAQIKMISYLAFVLRGMGEQHDNEGQALVLAALRILQDCPSMAISARKDLMIVFRHLIGTPHRKALLPQIDKLFDERVLLGTGMGSRETIRSTAFGCVADLLHHLRAELSPPQLTRVCGAFLRHFHNPYLSNQIHILSAKMIYNVIEVVTVKEVPQAAARLLTTIMEASVDKLESMAIVQSETSSRIERQKKGETSDTDITTIEKARPVGGASYATDKPEDVILEYRLLFRTLLHGFRHVLTGLKKVDGPVPDGVIIARILRGSVRCLSLFDGEGRELSEVMEWFSSVLLEVNLHVFQEVWTQEIGFIFESIQKRPPLLHVTQILFSRDATSPTLVAIVLRFLIDRLPLLGEEDDQTAVIEIRMFKMVFNAVSTFPGANEPILASHLGKLIMDCFPLAAKASKPTNYFHLLKGLFRAIGGGGGRFELLYKEVLPLLPEMLECLNRQLFASEGLSRDLIVELCLTVPLRLTHLLPYLTYLMQPLALALRGNHELVSQGLRTLELCIDNLTPDFLDPTLNTVLRELMEALHSHLKPLPANHHHAHTTIRILGKLGGRNRRLLSKEPALKYQDYSDPAKAHISFGTETGSIELGPVATLAASTLASAKSSAASRNHAYAYLESCVALILAEGVKGHKREEVFTSCLTGLLDAMHIPDLKEKATALFQQISEHIFALEGRRTVSKDAISLRYPTPLFSCYLDALPHGLARENVSESGYMQDLLGAMMRKLMNRATPLENFSIDIVTTIHPIASKFSSLCLDELWVRKSAGCRGIKMMTEMPEPGVKWVSDREVELVRVLLHVLKGMPYDLPDDVEMVYSVLVRVLTVGHGDPSVVTEDSRKKLTSVAGIFFADLSGANAIVRRTAQQCLELLVRLTGHTASELLMPHRERMLTAIYTKPLRALHFPIQIGMIEAVRYCLSLDPPLPELNDELLRLLHEALGLADAEDSALMSQRNPRQASLEVVKLRVACIKLLTASMPLTDFFSKQHQTRQRVTSVYFKSLYSPTPEVKQVAHEGLRMVLTHQTRLPKELLQTGLRPILMNLADPKRLSVPGLEGLARLLELLTNYFKVEIGHKLLDHFRSVADPQMLQQSSRLPLTENEGITKLVRLANIFHLLPSAANIFLESLVNNIVQTEAQMHFSGQSPFSEPLAKYLDRYPSEAIDFFMRHLHFPRHMRTLRSIIQANLAPNLLRELISRTPTLVSVCFEGRDVTSVLPGLMLCSDIAKLAPYWLKSNQFVLDAIIKLWRTELTSSEQSPGLQGDSTQRCILMIAIFRMALEQTPRIDILFEIIGVFIGERPYDLVQLSQFLYDHVALNPSLIYRRNVLLRFLIWFQDTSFPWSHKTHFFRFIVTPTILVHSNRPSKEGLVDSDFVQKILKRVWIPMIDNATFAGADDMFKVELLHFTTIMVHKYGDYLADIKKDIIKCAWHFITSEDTLVKHTAYILAARFFEAFEGPQKFLIRVWTGLLRPPHNEGKNLVRTALDILSPVLQRSQQPEPGYPLWAKNTRRLLAEEGNSWSQIGLIYHLITRQKSLFYPVRALFIPHIVNYLSKLGLQPTSNSESRILSVDILQVIFDWEQQATSPNPDGDAMVVTDGPPPWITPLSFRETMVSYLVRLATLQDGQTRTVVTPRALTLLRLVIGPGGWTDVTVKLPYFSRALQQNDLTADGALPTAIGAAKVLQVVAAEKPDEWFKSNAEILTKLVRKGMVTEDNGLLDSLHPIVDRLLRLYPLPKEDEEQQQDDQADFHSFVSSAIHDSLRNGTNLRGSLLMLKSIVQVEPERIQAFSTALMKLLGNKAKDHLQSVPTAPTFEGLVRLVTAILEISQIGVSYLGEQRKPLLQSLVALVEKSKSITLCRYLLDLAREWALKRRDPIPTMKEKATLLQRMVTFEMRGQHGEALFNNYLELIFDIYSEPSLRRSDLTVRLESPFLLGCRSTDVALREKFISLLDVSVPRSLFGRLSYILGSQSWEPLADHNWIFLALHLLLGSVDVAHPLTIDKKVALESGPIKTPFTLGKAASIIRPMQHLLFLDPKTAHDAWVNIFPLAWSRLLRREQIDITHHLIALLGKDYHMSQSTMRPNVIQSLLAGAHACSPPMTLPPHLVKYLAKTYGAWHIAIEILEASFDQVREDETIVRDTVYDSLAEVYAELAEDDMFYGLWRKRCLHPETNVALAFEQNGMWEHASNMYEAAQNKVRTNVIPFTEPEYCLWEDHWMLAAEKLQQWDTLYELARNDNNHELMLESAWRIKDWAEHKESLEEQINLLPEVGTPRRKVFEAFIALLKLPAAMDKNTEFTRILEEAMQLSLRKWVAMPTHLSVAHVPLLQHFQQFVELQEAVQIFGGLSSTTAQNLEKKSSDLKMVLQAWRERLPNLCDDISIWSDLVAWRQNVFNAINKAYIPLITPASQGGNGPGQTNTFGYRGYHETAWIINRFAHVARKHELLDVCFTSLNKIYTLPNIEISEAFLKLREQARCHYQKPGDLQQGLEVINNTNLMYFSQPQKAEFYTLKGMFHAKFGRNEEANQAYSQAVQLDMQQAKAWAAWGKYNDRMFKEHPGEMTHAASAVSCYLQAAGLYKSGKSRPLLVRVLWLLSVDDDSFTISRAFDTYKGDAAYWYWITLIPQLCLSISQKEVKQARYILLNLAKLFPQALFFHLRTTREDMQQVKNQAAQRASQLAQAQAAAQAAEAPKPDPDHGAQDSTPDSKTPMAVDTPPRPGAVPFPQRQAWDYVEEVMQILKTAFPLLIMNMETVVEQIILRFKATQEEEIYRLICMLLQDAMSQYIIRTPTLDDDGMVSEQTNTTLSRLVLNLRGSARIQKDYEEDFLSTKLTLSEYISRLQRWRDKYERYLDARPRLQSLDTLSHYLIEFQYGKFDDIEVPGQYTEDKDTNQTFVKILRFDNKFENCRSHGYCWRRITIHGTDHSKTSFAVQMPSARHCRREERVMQLFRTFNGALARKKETRKRNLQFHLPATVSFHPNVRLLQNDSSYITLGEIYNQYCDEINISREDAIFVIGEKVKVAMQEFKQSIGRSPTKNEYLTLKKESFDEVRDKIARPDILTRYMIRTMDGPTELWRMRKQFALQLACTSFMTYVLSLTSRMPSRFHISRSTGQIAMSELLPGVANQHPVFASNDVVPFRFTPNMQHFIGPILTEGILATGIMALGRCLTEPEFELDQHLCLFSKDEVMTWMHQRGKPWKFDLSFRNHVAVNIEGVVKRAEALACKLERDQAAQNGQNANTVPVIQTVTNMISTATNPMNLIKMTELSTPWF